MKRVYPTLQVTTNLASALCGEKGQQKENGPRLSSYKPIDDEEWIPITTYCRHSGWSREKEGVYKVRSEVGL